MLFVELQQSCTKLLKQLPLC